MQKHLAGGTPDLQPRAFVLAAAIVALEPDERAVWILFRHLRDPTDVAAQAVVQRLGRAVRDKREHTDRVDGERGQRRARVHSVSDIRRLRGHHCLMAHPRKS